MLIINIQGKSSALYYNIALFRKKVELKEHILMLNNIIAVFNEYFDMVPAVSNELKNEVYKLRYQVYCLETGFENPEQYSEGMEFDEFDNHSVHYLIRHRKFGVYVATTRLILPDITNPEKLFPLEIHSQIENSEALKHISRHHLAEASRFCISKNFRRRINESKTVTGIDPESENLFTQNRRRIPQITLALIACSIKMSYENDIHDWYALMEPALIRFFSTLGVEFIGVGPITEYHGKRQPCTIKITDLLAGVAEKNVTYWNMLTNNGQFCKK